MSSKIANNDEEKYHVIVKMRMLTKLLLLYCMNGVHDSGVFAVLVMNAVFWIVTWKQYCCDVGECGVYCVCDMGMCVCVNLWIASLNFVPKSIFFPAICTNEKVSVRSLTNSCSCECVYCECRQTYSEYVVLLTHKNLTIFPIEWRWRMEVERAKKKIRKTKEKKIRLH